MIRRVSTARAIAAITDGGFSLKRRNRLIRAVYEPTHAKKHIIRILGLLPASERVQLQHKQRANA